MHIYYSKFAFAGKYVLVIMILMKWKISIAEELEKFYLTPRIYAISLDTLQD